MYAQLEASKFITRDMPRITKRLTVVCQLHHSFIAANA